MAQAIPFPSLAWFEQLGKCMEAHRARHEHLGYIDCVAGFCVLDGGPDGGEWTAHVTFEEFAMTGLREATRAQQTEADFTIEGALEDWREMIESIAAGRGRPDLEHTLNRLTHMGTPLHLASDDPLRADLYFRYNQSLQEFVNASAEFETTFPGPPAG